MLADAAVERLHPLTPGVSPECKIIVGAAVGLATRPGLVDTDRMHVDWGGNLPVARLFADRYARLHEIDRHRIPELD